MHNSHNWTLPVKYFGKNSVLLFPTFPTGESFSTTSEYRQLEDACCKQHLTSPTSALSPYIIILYLDVLCMEYNYSLIFLTLGNAILFIIWLGIPEDSLIAEICMAC
jgi:hypothetical protein